MTKFLFFNVPGYGHVNPTLPVVQELVHRGHKVVYYNTATFRPHVERTGAEFRPYSDLDVLPKHMTQMAENLVNISNFLLSESVRQVPFVLEQIEREQPDLVLYDSICLWGHQGAILANVPSIASHTTIIFEGVPGMLKARDYVYAITQAVPHLPKLLRIKRKLIQSFGPQIFPNKDIFPVVGDLNIQYTSRLFQPETEFINGRFRHTGPSIQPNTRTPHTFPFDQLNDDPVVYISMGTIHQQTAQFYRTCYQAFADFPAQFVLALGQQLNPTDLGAAPANFIVQPYVPQLELLPKVDLFITHGGINSVQEGLYFGVPLLVVPQQMEQMLNGRLVAKHGAGVVLGKRPLPSVTPDLLKETVTNLLSDKTFAMAAHQIGDSFMDSGGYMKAVDEIIAFAPK
ncbi:MAG: glycosyl transferase [Chloroflexi bacterium]|nr:MAG: glycosyl transferase [Chloroflexota bacterium]